MTAPDEDPELDELLARRSRLSRQYASIGKEEPPRSTDLRVLAAAERAARLPERPLARSRPRWMMPVVLAATVLMSVSIMWGLGKDPTPVVTRMAMNMRGPPPPVVVSLDPSTSPANPPKQAASPAAPAERAPRVKESASGSVAFTEPVMADKKSGAMRAAPSAALAGEAVMPATAVDSLGRQAAESAGLTGADLERVIAFLRAPARTGAETGAVAAAPRLGKADAAQAESATTTADADTGLRNLQRLYDAGDKAGALAALAEFRQRFPLHPVSELLTRPRP